MDRIRVVGLADWIWLKTRSRNQDADRRLWVSERFWGGESSGDVTFVTCRLTLGIDHVVNDGSVIQMYSVAVMPTWQYGAH